MVFNWSLSETNLYIWQKIQKLRQELLQLQGIDKQALNGKTGPVAVRKISKKLNLKKTREKRRRFLSIKTSFLLTPKKANIDVKEAEKQESSIDA